MSAVAKTYAGDRTIDGIQVAVDGRPLDPRYDLQRLTDNGFEWSYEGPEPEQLAFALLVDHLGDAEKAAALRGRLGNPSFLASAPEEVVEEARQNLAAREAEEAQLRAALARLSELE